MKTVKINSDRFNVTDIQPTMKGGNDKQLTLTIPYLEYEEKSLHTYIVDAKRILDKESKSLNKIGIQRLLCALLIEVVGNDNYGIDN